ATGHGDGVQRQRERDTTAEHGEPIVDRSAARLEVLDRPLVGLRRVPCPERAQVAPPAGLRIPLAGIEPILSRAELADHRASPHASAPVSAPTRIALVLPLVPAQRTAVHSTRRARPVRRAAKRAWRLDSTVAERHCVWAGSPQEGPVSEAINIQFT